jgi:hypothetical protein
LNVQKHQRYSFHRVDEVTVRILVRKTDFLKPQIQFFLKNNYFTRSKVHELVTISVLKNSQSLIPYISTLNVFTAEGGHAHGCCKKTKFLFSRHWKVVYSQDHKHNISWWINRKVRCISIKNLQGGQNHLQMGHCPPGGYATIYM